MILGIDASNLRGAGGITHLVNLLKSAEPEKFNFKRVIVWGGRIPLELLPQFDWLELRELKQLNRQKIERLLWHNLKFDEIVKSSSCDVLYVPGGLYLGKFNPYVALCQTLLPFNRRESSRYGISTRGVRIQLLKHGQARTFKSSNGIIFLTKYAKELVTANVPQIKKKPNIVIPHGVDPAFTNNKQKTFNKNHVTNILYVSTIDLYKHQWNVVSAVSLLRKEGFAVELSLVGNSYYKALKSLNKTIDRLDTNRDFVKYRGGIDYQDLPSIYNETDIFVFASSCENLPIILLEAMASRLPIACSQLSPMPEILRDAGVYFDPFSVISIKESIRYLINNPDSSYNFSQKAGLYSKNFSWEACADKTFAFINKNLKNQRNEKN